MLTRHLDQELVLFRKELEMPQEVRLKRFGLNCNLLLRLDECHHGEYPKIQTTCPREWAEMRFVE
jgi:hypothetical protein